MKEDPRLGSARLHADAERLEAQARLSWERESAVLLGAGLRDGMTVLDVGCGPGAITRRLLERLPHALVVGVDLDPDMAARARETVAAVAPERAEILEASALNLDLPDDTFDFALARFVFQHVASPRLAAEEMLRVLRPGGTVAVLDIDDTLGGVTSPPFPAFAAMSGRLRLQQLQRGGNREVGRHLPGLLREAGFEDVRLEVIALDSRDLGLEAFRPQYEARRYRALLAASAISEADLESYAEACDAFFATPGAFILELLMVALGRKSAPPQRPDAAAPRRA